METAERRTIARVRGSSARHQRGTTIVEFTLIFTLFFMVVGFIIQGAFLFNAWLVVTNATREAARAGAPCFLRPNNLDCKASDIEQYAYQAAAGTNPSQFTPSARACVDTTTNPSTQVLEVRAVYYVPIVAPFVDTMFPQNPIQVAAQSRMRLENPTDLSTNPLPNC